MGYNSTRNSNLCVSASQAISQGISKEGGLFVPSDFHKITNDDLLRFKEMNYNQLATELLSKFLPEFDLSKLTDSVNSAYSSFDCDNTVELSELVNFGHVLELWHGPTCAFKDVALQLLPHLLAMSVSNTGIDKEIVILVATSGDTGKAALEGFKDVDGTKIMVFYPNDGVSPMQKLQMVTQEGSNVAVCAINGNFDDAQTGVKKIFTDPDIISALDENSKMFSSANSINWGRLVPQIMYYVYSYVELLKKEKIALGDKINFVVPTGNFGNILAGYYAMKMGLPVNKLICASNENNVLTDFINTGVYDRNRAFHTTISPSMDILISSNLERLIYDLSDDEKVKELYSSLNTTGKFDVGEDIKEKIKSIFCAECANDCETLDEIRNIYKTYSYTIDTHTAVAFSAYKKYVAKTGDKTETVLVSTASPYKFSASVLKALGIETEGLSEFELTEKLHEASKMPIPRSLSELNGKTVRFSGSIDSEDMKKFVFDTLNIK